MTEVLDIAKKDGRWSECPACSETIITSKLLENKWVCPHCDHHFRINARDRIALTCDEGSFVEIETAPVRSEELSPTADEALKCGRAQILGQPCVLGVMDFSFKGGSMGVTVGQAIVDLMLNA
ncbi:MAG TPA: carboxyl transferase domain-containing protein, partial [Desulfomonilia bacterium]|nr:carboxyl transferase domain-containing protein [Desulfomonilia bacterium]